MLFRSLYFSGDLNNTEQDKYNAILQGREGVK